MNLKIIQTPDYILGVDKEAILHDEDIHISPIREGIMNTFIIDNKVGNDNYKSRPLDRKDCWKVIAHIPLNGNKPLERVSFLPEIEDKSKQAAYEHCKQNFGLRYEGFVEGYKAAGYTEEDVRKAYQQGLKDSGKLGYSFKQFIESLKPFPIEFEVEMELVDYTYPKGDGTNDGNGQPVYEPKILNNIIQGKYIWKQLN